MTNKIVIGLIALAAVTVNAAIIQEETSGSYGWEDGASILGYYGNVDLEQTIKTTNMAYEGTSSLQVVENPLSSTPEAYVAWITGVTEGDVITATAWVMGQSNGVDLDSKGRLWFKYTGADDINTYSGSATNSNTAYAGEAATWTSFTQTVTVAAGQSAVALATRIYSYGANDTIYVDNLTVSVNSDAATISFPEVVPEPATMALLGLGGLALRRKRA